jgi:hypothetical protein
VKGIGRMTRQEALEHFEKNYVQVKALDSMEKIKKYYEVNKDKIVASFIESFKQICLKIKDSQSKGLKGNIGYIQCSMLRTNIMEKSMST